MAEKKEVYRSVKLTDNINPAELTVADQVRLLFSKISNNDEAELDASTKLSAANLRKVSALGKLLDKAAEKMQELGEPSVTIGVSSEFLPYIDEVVDKEHGKGRYYDIAVYKKDLPITVSHKFIVRISKKRSEVARK